MTVSGAGPDRDGDGMPDTWEEAAGLDADRQNATEDPDRDGAVNAHEYAAGTNPLEATSALRLDVQADARVSFYSVSDRRYQLERTAALIAPWGIVGPQISGTGAVIQLNVEPAGWFVFYRIRLVQ